MLSSPETLVLTRLVDCSPRGLFCSLARLYEENLRAKHITVTVIVPTQGFKWIPADYRGNINIRQCDHHFVGLAALSGPSRTLREPYANLCERVVICFRLFNDGVVYASLLFLFYLVNLIMHMKFTSPAVSMMSRARYCPSSVM